MSGLFPLGLFLLELSDNARRGVVWDTLWMCHVANLMMALGALTRRPLVVRMGALWVAVGTPLWVRELGLDPSIAPVSYLSHLGGLAFALVWLRRAEPDWLRGKAWPGAWAIFLVVRLLSSWLTPAELNVNASQHMRDGFDTLLGSYWQYWLSSSLAALPCLWAVDRLCLGVSAAGGLSGVVAEGNSSQERASG